MSNDLKNTVQLLISVIACTIDLNINKEFLSIEKSETFDTNHTFEEVNEHKLN